MQRHCGEIGDEDGLDPIALAKLHREAERSELIARATHPNANRKALQLCRQVERALSFIIPDVGDERLLGSFIASVVPAPHTHHLLVTVELAEIVSEVELVELQEFLLASKSRVRAEIAQSINRRKTPDVTLQVINPRGE